MTDTETIDELKREIAYLKEELKGFHAVMKLEMRNNTMHIVRLYNRTGALDDRLLPLEEKFFPEVVEAREQFRVIAQNIKGATDAEPDAKND